MVDVPEMDLERAVGDGSFGSGLRPVREESTGTRVWPVAPGSMALRVGPAAEVSVGARMRPVVDGSVAARIRPVADVSAGMRIRPVTAASAAVRVRPVGDGSGIRRVRPVTLPSCSGLLRDVAEVSEIADEPGGGSGAGCDWVELWRSSERRASALNTLEQRPQRTNPWATRRSAAVTTSVSAHLGQTVYIAIQCAVRRPPQ